MVIDRGSLDTVGNAEPREHIEDDEAEERVDEEHGEDWAEDKGEAAEDPDLCVGHVDVQLGAFIQRLVSIDCLALCFVGVLCRATPFLLVSSSRTVPEQEGQSKLSEWNQYCDNHLLEH